MRKLIVLLLALMLLPLTALACTPTTPADPEMIATLLPGFTLVDSIDDGDTLRLLMRNPADELVFIGGVKAADGTWRFTESTPLPEGSILGVENFTHSLGIPTETYFNAVSVSPYADGAWGVSYIEYSGCAPSISLSKHAISVSGRDINSSFGDHPWSDITTIDWASLPASYEEAIRRLDTTNWAVVSNPDPADRLHLRVSPDRDSASLGKYYNRTPVQIRQYGEKWCAVTVCGLDGWMMTDYLAFGADMDGVEYAGPSLSWKENLPEERLYESPRVTSACEVKAAPDSWPSFYIMGVAGDFYHVWMPDTEDYAYIRMEDLWPGNG